MSLSLRDRIAIAIYPERVVWLRAGKGRRAEVTGKGIVPCQAEAGTSWRGALVAVPEALAAAGAASTQVSVLLSNRLMRYAISSNPDSANSREELDMMARHAFERTHGEAASGWDIRLSDAAPGCSALVSAVDRELVVALRDSVGAAGAQLVSLQPYLMAAFNRQAETMPNAGGIFVLAEPERLCHVAWKSGGWCAVQQIHADCSRPIGLHDTLDRMAMTQDLDTNRAVRFCAPEFHSNLAAGGRWEIETTPLTWPAGLVPEEHGAWAGAMLALN